MKVPVLLLLTAALSFAGRGNAADHGLKSVRVTTPQGYDRDLLQDNLQAANAHANGGKGVRATYSAAIFKGKVQTTMHTCIRF